MQLIIARNIRAIHYVGHICNILPLNGRIIDKKERAVYINVYIILVLCAGPEFDIQGIAPAIEVIETVDDLNYITVRSTNKIFPPVFSVHTQPVSLGIPVYVSVLHS